LWYVSLTKTSWVMFCDARKTTTRNSRFTRRTHENTQNHRGDHFVLVRIISGLPSTSRPKRPCCHARGRTQGPALLADRLGPQGRKVRGANHICIYLARARARAGGNRLQDGNLLLPVRGNDHASSGLGRVKKCRDGLSGNFYRLLGLSGIFAGTHRPAQKVASPPLTFRRSPRQKERTPFLTSSSKGKAFSLFFSPPFSPFLPVNPLLPRTKKAPPPPAGGFRRGFL